VTVALISALLTAFTIGVVVTTSTLSDFSGTANKSKAANLAANTLLYRLTEFGELLVNVPASKMPHVLHATVRWAGALLIVLTAFGLATRIREIGPTEVFLICYSAVLFLWPFYDARFWLPVIPLIAAYTAVALARLRIPSVLVALYFTFFAASGLAAIAYTTRISFSGAKFPDRYGDGTLRPTYCVAFQSCPDGFDLQKVDAKALALLRKYN
jgi:hypothetical protein